MPWAAAGSEAATLVDWYRMFRGSMAPEDQDENELPEVEVTDREPVGPWRQRNELYQHGPAPLPGPNDDPDGEPWRSRVTFRSFDEYPSRVHGTSRWPRRHRLTNDPWWS